jgi:Subunit ChlI of Mg-chelatase
LSGWKPSKWIEVDAGWGNPDKIAVVGLPDTAVKESRDRVTFAIGNSGLRWPAGKGLPSNGSSRFLNQHPPLPRTATTTAFPVLASPPSSKTSDSQVFANATLDALANASTSLSAALPINSRRFIAE